MRGPGVLAVVLLSLFVPATESHGQPLPPKARVEFDDCVVLIPAMGYDQSNSLEHELSSADVLRVKRILEQARDQSEDMRRKVADACSEQKNGVRGHPSLKPTLTLQVWRNAPGVNMAAAYPKSGSANPTPGVAQVDLGDVDAVPSFWTADSDSELTDVLNRSYLTRLLAHEFDHLRDPPAWGAWGRNHGDPLGNREESGSPVDDANLVKAQVGSGDVRTAYGGDQIPYSGGTTLPGKTATLRYTDLINRSRRVEAPDGGSGHGTALLPEQIGTLPGEPCGAGAGDSCYPPATEGDTDLDGVADPRDNCPDLSNPWQLDEDGSGTGDDCEPEPGGETVRGTITGVVIAEREDRDGNSQLLLATPAWVGEQEVDEIRLQMPPQVAERLEPTLLPPGWTMKATDGEVVLSGPPVADGDVVAVALGLAPDTELSEVSLEALSGGSSVLSREAAPVELPMVETLASLDAVLRLPQLVSPRETVTFTPLDPTRTPGGGYWQIGGTGADWNLDLEMPSYSFSLPPESDPGLELRIGYTDPWGEVLVDAPAEDTRVIPRGPAAIRPPRITGCSSKVLSGGTFCVCGLFPDDDSRSGVTLNGEPLGPPVSASDRILNFRLPAGLAPGAFTVVGLGSAGYGEEDRASGIHISVAGTIDRERFLRGESTPLRLSLEGTDEPTSLRLWNTTPGIVSLEGGEDQIVTTSGGQPNTVERDVRGLVRGDFLINYELDLSSCPCAGGGG